MGTKRRSTDSRAIALRAAAAAKNKKALKVVVLDLRTISGFCDYFVISSATSLRHAGAVAEEIEQELAREGIHPLGRVDRHDESGWLVLDYSSVIAHVFTQPLREFYGLERLWSDAVRVRARASS